MMVAFRKAEGIAETTSNRWRHQISTLRVRNVQQWRDLEKENAHLKCLLIDGHVELAVLKDTPTEI